MGEGRIAAPVAYLALDELDHPRAHLAAAGYRRRGATLAGPDSRSDKGRS